MANPAKKRIKTLKARYGKNWAQSIGKKSAETNFKKYGADYYAKIGSIGGKKEAKEDRAFYKDRELARAAAYKRWEGKRGKTTG